jgi:murein DD-endopeptidase MepM/ murein hydrolase activator NlpD
MIKFLPIFFILGISYSLTSQVVLDTIDTPGGKVVLYANKKWDFVKEDQFDGILNNHIYNIISSNPRLNYVQTWDNEVCYTSDRKNDLGKLNDTIWLCVNEDHDDGFHVPFHGNVTSRYGFRKGRYHNGIDIALNVGDTVRAAWSGKVRYAKFNDGGFGNLVIIRHYNGLESFYAHLNEHLCVPNQDVKAGDPIGLGGNTGHSFGPHLHFELRFYDAPMNPEEVIDFDNLKLKDQNLLVHKDLFRPGAKPSDFGEHGESVANELPIKPIVLKPVHKYYKVRPGDTLSEIATKSNTTILKICQLNGIRQSTSLQIGRSLRVK